MKLFLSLWSFVIELELLHKEDDPDRILICYTYFMFRIGFGCGFRVFSSSMSYGIGLGRHVFYRQTASWKKRLLKCRSSLDDVKNYDKEQETEDE